MRNEREISDRPYVPPPLPYVSCIFPLAQHHGPPQLTSLAPLQLELVKQSSLDPETLPSNSTSRSLALGTTGSNVSRNPGKIPFDMKQLDAVQKRRFIMLKGKKDRLERELSKLS